MPELLPEVEDELLEEEPVVLLTWLEPELLPEAEDELLEEEPVVLLTWLEPELLPEAEDELLEEDPVDLLTCVAEEVLLVLLEEELVAADLLSELPVVLLTWLEEEFPEDAEVDLLAVLPEVDLEVLEVLEELLEVFPPVLLTCALISPAEHTVAAARTAARSLLVKFLILSRFWS